MAEEGFALTELYEVWPILALGERVEGFELLRRDDQEAPSHLFARHNLQMIPIVDSERRIN